MRLPPRPSWPSGAAAGGLRSLAGRLRRPGESDPAGGPDAAMDPDVPPASGPGPAAPRRGARVAPEAAPDAGPSRLRRLAGAPVVRRVALGVGSVLVLAGVPAAVHAGGVLDVERVAVVGLQGPDAAAIRDELEGAALGRPVTTLSAGALRRAVAHRAVVADVALDRRPPDAVQIVVRMRRAVAAADAGGGRRIALDGRGLPLEGTRPNGLPLVDGRAGGRRPTPAVRRQTAALRAAPEPLLRRAERVAVGRAAGAVSVRLRRGPLLVLGDPRDGSAAWRAAAAVLADPSSAGASWIDLRDPSRPVAGSGPPPADAGLGAPEERLPREVEGQAGPEAPMAPEPPAGPAPDAAPQDAAVAPPKAAGPDGAAAGDGAPELGTGAATSPPPEGTTTPRAAATADGADPPTPVAPSSTTPQP